MQTIATCAACGEKKELCGSCRIDGIQQPRVCKDCLIRSMSTGDYGVNDLYWLVQLGEMNDTDSIEALKANKSFTVSPDAKSALRVGKLTAKKLRLTKTAKSRRTKLP